MGANRPPRDRNRHPDAVDEYDPCAITRIKQLQLLDLAGHYTLGADIDASTTQDWNGGQGFEPVGTETEPFTGSLAGAGFTVRGLFINRPEIDRVGLFGQVGAGGEIEGLTLTDVEITGKGRVGGLAATN